MYKILLVSALVLLCGACAGSRPLPEATETHDVSDAETNAAEAADTVSAVRDALAAPAVAGATASSRDAAIARHLAWESDDPNQLIIHDGYVINFNETHKTPNWTLNAITPDQIAPRDPSLRRASSFGVDPLFDAGKQARHGDYSNSGFDRGHFTPAADFSQDQTLKDATFLVTNIGPQTPDLNQRIWRELEEHIRGLVSDSMATTHVVTGAVYASRNARNRGVSRKHIGIASSFYKIVYLQAATWDYAYAFLIPHLFAYDNENPACYQVTVDEIERIAGEDFLDRLPDDKERLMEAARLDVSGWLEPCAQGR